MEPPTLDRLRDAAVTCDPHGNDVGFFKGCEEVFGYMEATFS